MGRHSADDFSEAELDKLWDEMEENAESDPEDD